MTERGGTIADPAVADPQELAASLVAAARARDGLLLCTDFDGTLAPIVPTPGEARPLPAAAAALRWLSREGAASGDGATAPVQLAVVTSRDADDVVARVGLGPEAVVVGCAGLERWADGRVELDPRVPEWLPALADATTEIADALAAERVPGARLERKHCGSVVHTRGLPPEADAAAAALVEEVAARTGLDVARGKRALELRPPVRVDKAEAVASLRTGRWTGAALCVAGDDLPDVAMLRLASSMPGGTAVAVADAETPAEVIGAADVSVAGPTAWARVLSEVARLLVGD